MMKDYTTTLDCTILKKIPLVDQVSFFSAIKPVLKSYPARTMIPLHDIDMLGQLQNKLAVLHQINHEGEVILSKFITMHHVLDYSAQTGNDRYEIETCQETVICWMPRESFYEYANKHPELYKGMLQCETKERDILDRFLAVMNRPKAAQKVWHLLQWFEYVEQKPNFVIPIPYVRLAVMIGISRDHLRDCLLQLQKANIIDIKDTYRITMLPITKKGKHLKTSLKDE